MDSHAKIYLPSLCDLEGRADTQESIILNITALLIKRDILEAVCIKMVRIFKSMGEILWISHQIYVFKWPIDQKKTHHFSLFIIKILLAWQVDSIMIFKLCWHIGCTCFFWHLDTFSVSLMGGGELSLEEIYNFKNQALSEYIKMCETPLLFQTFLFL